MNLYPLLAAAVGGEIIDLVGQTGPVAKVVLLILLIFSLVSWAIILSKWSVLRRARVQSGRFVRAFRKAQRLQDVGAVAEQFRPSPLVGVFEGGFEEYRRQGAVANGMVRSPLAIQRAMQIANAAPCAPVMNHLRPVIDHPPSTRCAVVASIEGSDPAPGAGSVIAKHDRVSPAANGAR